MKHLLACLEGETDSYVMTANGMTLSYAVIPMLDLQRSKGNIISARLAKSVEHETLNLGVVRSNNTLGDF